MLEHGDRGVLGENADGPAFVSKSTSDSSGSLGSTHREKVVRGSWQGRCVFCPDCAHSDIEVVPNWCQSDHCPESS